jgi:hypothetical protein
MEFLQSLDGVYRRNQRAIFNMLRGVLEYPASIEARAAKIASDSLFLVNDAEPDTATGAAFLHLWDVVLSMVTQIPAGHDWQQTLVLALDTIRQREGAARGESPVCSSF